jgi:hypothetical protein
MSRSQLFSDADDPLATTASSFGQGNNSVSKPKNAAKDSLLIDSTKIEEIITRMRDAETKNEYLTSVIGELKSKQRGQSSSAYK